MSKANHSGRSRRAVDSDHALEELLRSAGPRERPPEADERELRRALLEEWDAVTGRRILWRRLAGAAALVLVAVGAGLLLRTGYAPEPVPVAQIERVVGSVAISDGASGEGRAAGLGEDVTAGTIIRTGEGQLGLRLVGDGSLRLAPGTQLKMTDAAEVELLEGRLYFDSEAGRAGPGAARAGLIVHTTAGIVRDVGTQFLAVLEADRLEVGVRDGQVDLTRGDERARAGPGERLIVVGDAERGIRRGSIDPVGEEWAWAERLAPPFDIDGRYLVELLEWVAAQTGRTVQYADSEAERVAGVTVLHGSVDLPPLSKLAAVLATTDLTHRIDDETILISVK